MSTQPTVSCAKTDGFAERISMKVQVAFQGGGARLALFFPIVEALLEIEREGIIQITGAAGTSAGAIAAALVAGKGTTQLLQNQLLNDANNNSDTIRRILPEITWMKIMSLVLFKQPFANELDLKDFLTRCLMVCGISPDLPLSEFERRGRPFFASIADLRTRSVQPHLPESTLMQALMTSAGLPLYYRVSAERVDGGVLNNLPTDMLDSTRGHILAFAFADDPYVKAPSNPIGLMFSMLNAAMANAIRLMKSRIGSDFVYTIPTRFDVFEVEGMEIEEFIKFVKSTSAYIVAKEAAIKWTKERVEFLKQPPMPIIVESSSGPKARLGDLSKSAQKLFDLYKRADNIVLETTMIEWLRTALTKVIRQDLILLDL